MLTVNGYKNHPEPEFNTALQISNKGTAYVSDVTGNKRVVGHWLFTKGDFNKAQQNIAVLSTKKAEWASVQSKLVYLQQSVNKGLELKSNSAMKSEFENHASIEGPFQGAAQAALKYGVNKNYYVPQLIPYVEGGINKSINNPLVVNDNDGNREFSLYPNPTNNIINFIYKGTDENVLLYTLTNALGIIVHEGSIKSGTKIEIPMQNYVNGVYILTAFNGKTKMFQTKVICFK
ncbi:MAG: hypothetical protein JWO32_2546 [Bacteroidetes bacterium]|nr:hypothetical protein [Bacteroidota bacterium]